MSAQTAPTFEERAKFVREKIQSKFKDGVPASSEEFTALRKSIMPDMQSIVNELDFMRSGSKENRPKDISLAEYAQARYGISPDSENKSAENLLRILGIDFGATTLNYLQSQGDNPEGYRWLTPELIREAIRLGRALGGMWRNWVFQEENITQPSIKMPQIDVSDAMPSKMGEAETYPMGSLNFGEREIQLQRIGMGMKITDAVKKYTNLSLLTIFFQDMGVKLDMGLDVMALDVLINGDGNGNSAPVIGVIDTAKGVQYADLLGLWITMSQLGRLPDSMLSNKNVAIKLLSDPLLISTQTLVPGRETKMLRPRTPLPNAQSYDISGLMPVDNQVMVINSNMALMKFNSDALKMESARIAERAMDGAYATLTTGFASYMRDARFILDGSVAYGSAPIPSWADVSATLAANILSNL